MDYEEQGNVTTTIRCIPATLIGQMIPVHPIPIPFPASSGSVEVITGFILGFIVATVCIEVYLDCDGEPDDDNADYSIKLLMLFTLQLTLVGFILKLEKYK